MFNLLPKCPFEIETKVFRIKLTPAECTGALGNPVVPEVKLTQKGWSKGSCSKIISGTFPSGVRPSSRKFSKNMLKIYGNSL